MDSILVKFPLTIKAKLTEKLKNKMLDEMRKTMQQAEDRLHKEPRLSAGNPAD